MEKMKIVERKKDITFFEDSNNRLWQRIGKGKIFKVRNGNMEYRKIAVNNGYTIKYNNNGVYGFSIWKGNKCLEDNYWSLEEVKKACMSL